MATPRRQVWTIQVAQAGTITCDPLRIDSRPPTAGEVWQAVLATVPNRYQPWQAVVYRVDPDRLEAAQLDERMRWGVLRILTDEQGRAWRSLHDRTGAAQVMDCVAL